VALAFEHPVTGERIEVNEPLPEELERLLGELRTSSPWAPEGPLEAGPA
jgi:hypothetical protein